MSQKRRWRWDGWNSVYRAILFLCSLLVLAAVAPALIQLLYVGPLGERTASCQSNLKQLGLALTQYDQDSDGAQPPVSAAGVGWREAIYPYVKSVGTYQCPGDYGTRSFTAANLPTSYAGNHLGRDGKGQERGAFSGPGEAPVNVSQFERPASTIVLADSRGDLNEEWDVTSPQFLPQQDAARELYTHVPRHLFFERPMGTLNVLLADGHVKRLYPMNTLTPVVNLWTRDNAPFTGQDLSNAQAVLRHAEQE